MAGCEDGNESRGCGWPLEAGKGKKMDSFLEPPEKKYILPTP